MENNDFQNGIWNNTNKSTSTQFKRLTMDDLTKALIDIKSKSNNTSYPIYCGAAMFKMFWDFIEKNSITVYGIKMIGVEGDLFIYEGVLFDKFPDNYDSLYISYINRFNSERAEEIQILELTDTKIVFKCSFMIPKDKDNIVLQWN